MAELPAFCIRKEKHVGIYPVILEGEETTVKVVAGTLRLKTINQMDSHYESMTGQRESEQAQIREDRQDSREQGRQMSNFEPNAESTPFEKTGKGLLELSEQATELVDEIADKHEELTKKINERLMEENLLKELRKIELQNMKERQKGNWDEQTYSDGGNQHKLKFNMEKATNKDALQKYREREAAETTGTRSGRKYKETYKGAKMMPLLVEGTQLKYSGAKKYLFRHQLCKFSHLKRCERPVIFIIGIPQL